MGTYIQFPGNHCLEYRDREMIGKCKILVATTSILNPNVGSAVTGFKAVATDPAAATIKTLDPKCINAINTIIANFFINSNNLKIYEIISIKYESKARIIARLHHLAISPVRTLYSPRGPGPQGPQAAIRNHELLLF